MTADIIDLFDREKMWEEVCDFRILKGYWNLVLKREILKDLLLSDRYKILALPEVLEVKTQDDVIRLEYVAVLVIKKYIDLFYRKYAKRFETENLHYDTVGKQLALFAFEKPGDKYSYTLQIDKREKKLIEEIKKLAKDLNKLIKEDTKTLPRIYFDKHLYVPVLLQSKKINRISPSGLVESEKEFISCLRDYLKKNKDKFSGVEIYLLRNYPRSGVGLFNLSGFYPDFIMWIRDNKNQRMVFIDPKGLEHEKELDQEKIKLKDDIKQLEQKLGKVNVVLESFILSITPYEKLIEGRTSPPSKDEYINQHVLFIKDNDYIEKLLNKVAKVDYS
jgi:hypothetical protein